MNWKGVVFLMFVAIMMMFSLWMVGKANECPLLCPKKTEINLISLGEQQKEEPQKCVEQNCDRFKFIGWGGIVVSLAFIALFLYKNRERKKIPFSRIKKAYIESMSKTEKVSVNSMATNFHLDEINDKYVFVLRDSHDGIDHYYMCEANMYTGEFGRGYGQYTTKLIEAEHWYATRARTDVTQSVAKALGQQQANELALRTLQQQQQIEAMRGKNNGTGEFR